MDYTLPIAKRTRSREAIMYQEYHKTIKKNRQDSSGSETASKTDSCFNQIKLVKSLNLGLGSDCRVDSESVACKEETDVEALSGDGDDDVSCVGMENSRKENNGTSEIETIVGTDDRVPIVLDDSEDKDELEFIGEGCDLAVEESDEDLNVAVDDNVFSGKSGESVEDSDELVSSSEENNDDPDDEDYEVEKSASGRDMESSSGEEEVIYVGESVVAKGACHEEHGEEKDVEENVQENFVDSENSKNDQIDKASDDLDNVDQELNCVAKRTRSHSNIACAKKKKNLSNLSHPLSIDKETLESPRLVENDNEDGDGKIYHSVRKTGFKKETKSKLILKCNDVQKILLDSILDWEKTGLEGSLSYRSEFDSTSEVEEPTPPTKSESEEEMDRLWTEMNFCLTCSDIHSTDPPMGENEATASQEVEDEATLCCRGHHEFVLDDEIGIYCKFCSYVKLEIKYIAAPFFKRGWGNSERRDFTIPDHSIYDEFCSHDSGFASQSAWDSFSHAEATVWDTIPGVKNSMYPHQCEGFEFIWNKIAGGIKLDELKKRTSSDSGNGCIISHAPGTGKSRLTIVFLQSYMNLYPNCKPVIVAPCSMLLTWEEEFKKWKVDIPFHNLNKPELSGKEHVYAVGLMNKVKHGERKEKLFRDMKLYSWYNQRSILGVSYQLFARLVGIYKKSGEPCKKVHENVRKILLEFPGLFVFDEGHTPRNHGSGIFKALSKVKTEKRIILSGTPFQNNFEELFNILCLVTPKFADSIQSRNQGVVKKRGRKTSEAKGKWTSLTSSIGKVSDDRCEFKDEDLKQLKTMIAPIVHIHKGTVLKESLPGLRHSVVVLQPDDFQKSLLEGVQRSFLKKKGSFQRSKSLLCLDHVVSVTSVHPSLLPEQSYEEEEFLVHKVKLERLRMNPEAGIKTKFLMMLLKLSAVMNEKVLVFSQYIEPLTLIMEQLKSCFNWIEGNEVLYMDGKRDVKERQSSIKVFNDPKSEAKILLASTKACGEGINLVGASRVLLLDVTWNPAVERQAISRAYRLGQQKFVYVYHLITSGTMEEKKCCRQAKKDRYSKLVFSSDGDGNQQKPVSEELEDKILEELVQHHKLIEEIIDQPEESRLIETFGTMDYNRSSCQKSQST